MKLVQSLRRRGVTLIEVMIAVAIIGIGSGLAVFITRLISTQFQNMQFLEIQQEGERSLYHLVRDIRNARGIVGVESSPEQKVTLKTYNLLLPADISLSASPSDTILSEVNIATTTYRFVETTNDNYLEKTVQLNGVVIEEKKFLRGVIQPDDLSLPGAQPIFFSEEPFNQVEINLRLGRGFYKDNPKVFQTIVMPRSKTGAGG